MNLQELQQVTGGEARGGDAVFSSVSTDTRSLQPGDLFVALSGPNFDANDFVEQAREMQASAALVSRAVDTGLPTVRVADTRVALGQLGAWNRQQSHACVIGLTGSQGKTTVKEMVARILGHRAEVLMTRGNLNNDLGVPRTLLEIGPGHEFAVVEMGANAPGEIAYVCALAQPQVAHITNAAATHLEGFGSLEGVARAKGEIWQGLRPGGVAVINADDPFAEQWRRQISKNRIVTISAKGDSGADYHVSGLCLDNESGSSFKLYSPAGEAMVRLNLLGKHNVANALAAAALAMEAGASLEDLRMGLAQVRPVPGRLCLKPGYNDARLIDDSYNASPASFRAAIDVLNSFGGEKILAVGDMGELGEEAESAHAELGRYARFHGVDYLFATGRLSETSAASFGPKAEFRADLDELGEMILERMRPGVTVLVKGSRSAGMDRLVKCLQAEE